MKFVSFGNGTSPEIKRSITIENEDEEPFEKIKNYEKFASFGPGKIPELNTARSDGHEIPFDRSKDEKFVSFGPKVKRSVTFTSEDCD